MSSGETGGQETLIEVELVLYPVMLAGATSGAGRKKNGKNEVRQISAVNSHLKRTKCSYSLLGF